MAFSLSAIGSFLASIQDVRFPSGSGTKADFAEG